MRKKLRHLLTGFVLFFCFSSLIQAQFGAWSFLRPVTAVNQTGSAQTDYQIRLVVNTAASISQGRMASDGRDIRFGDACATQTYDYWIEDYINTDTTVIWVRIPSIAAGATESFSMFYGNSNATAVSSFALTFPNAIVTSGNQTVTLGGDPGWIQVNAGDTLFLATNAVNVLRARTAQIDGVIFGAGRGRPAPGTSSNGNGPGGGFWGTSSGAGGGSYGGSGGVGGYDANDPIIQPGSVYGTTTGTDIDMGSTGGSASSVIAGNGGGGLRLESQWLTITGNINCNGGLAQQPGGGQGAGGGSGGGILLHGDRLSFTGSLSANGNGGSIGTSTANDDGGGGGGGRIKLFYNSSITNTGSTSVVGGPGGVNGGAGQGAPGSPGTIHVDTLAFTTVTGSTGPEQPNTGIPAPPAISTTGAACPGDSVAIIASGDFTSYTFAVGGTQLQAGTDSTYEFTADSNATFIITSVGVCTYVDTFQFNVQPLPQTGLTVPLGPYCEGNPVPLTVSGNFTGVVWSTGDMTGSIVVTTSGNYSVTVTDPNGCTNSDTIGLNFSPSPMALIAATPSGLAYCEGDTIQLCESGSWVTTGWSTGDTTNCISVTTGGPVTVTVVDSIGCSGADTVDLSFDPIPMPTISQNGFTLGTLLPYTTYQWLLNGSPIAGATNSNYTATGTGVYSVTVTSPNGCEGTSDTTFVFVSLDAALGLPGTKAYPNPFTDRLEVQSFLTAAGPVEMAVVDQAGRTWLQHSQDATAGDWNASLDLSELPSGLYFLRITAESGRAVLQVVKR